MTFCWYVSKMWRYLLAQTLVFVLIVIFLPFSEMWRTVLLLFLVFVYGLIQWFEGGSFERKKWSLE